VIVKIEEFCKRYGGRLIIWLAVASLIGAGVYGRISSHIGVEQYLPDALPEACAFHLQQGDPDETKFIYLGEDDTGLPVGYVTVTQGAGYGGPMTVVVGWSLDGTIETLQVPWHREDAAWFELLDEQGFYEQYIGRSYSEPLRLNEDIDSVTGATCSSSGLARGVLEGRSLLAEQLGDDSFTTKDEPVNFGIAEILLIAAFLAVMVMRLVPVLARFRWRRYLALAFGLVLLGIWTQQPLSLTNIASWLAGYAPSWCNCLFIYILVFSTLFLALAFNKNFYCSWLCPFAAVQEGLHLVTGTNIHPTPKCDRVLRNTRYYLLWLALFMALLLRNPSVTVFEPWSALFTLKGSLEMWLLVGLTLVAAVVIRSFWCRYLKPRWHNVIVILLVIAAAAISVVVLLLRVAALQGC